MVKKIIYSLLIFVSIFFVVDKVSATYDDSKTIYLDLESSKVITLLGNLESKLNEIVDYYKNNNPYNHKLVIFIDNNKNIHVRLLPESFVSTMGTNYCYLYVANSSSEGRYSYGCTTSNISIKTYTFTSSSDISQFKTDMITAYSSISGKRTGSHGVGANLGIKISFSDTTFDYFNSTHSGTFGLPYYSTEPIYNYEPYTGFTYYKIKLGDTVIPYESYLEPNNYFGKNYEEYSLSSITYSAIEVKFDVNDFVMIDEGNDINLEYEINLQNEMMIPLLPIPQEKIYRTLAPEEYTIGTTVNLLFDEKANSYSYNGTKHYDYWNTVTYRFEFPFTGDYVGNINFKFYSDSPYTITLEERANEENDIKYTELDLTGKYGVGFIPKVQTIELYKEFYGIFKVPMQNNYKLLFYKDYNWIYNKNHNNRKDNLLEDKILLSLEKFEYLFTEENKNSYLLFVNNNFENGTNASIYYNSNYFNYCILDESISSCNIINPNTNEETNINTNLSDVDSFKISNVFDTFLSFSNSTNFILENVTHFYNDYLPSELKSFFYISFGFVVIIVITKIVL